MEYELRLKKLEHLVSIAFGRRHAHTSEVASARQMMETEALDALCEGTPVNPDYLRRLLHEHTEDSRATRDKLGIRRVK